MSSISKRTHFDFLKLSLELPKSASILNGEKIFKFSLAVSYHHVSLLHQHPLSPLFSLPNMRLIFSSRSLQLLISFYDQQSFCNDRSLSTHSQKKPGADVTFLLLLPAPLLLLLIRKNRLICEQCDVSITSTSSATLLCNRRDHQAGLISRPLALH